MDVTWLSSVSLGADAAPTTVSIAGRRWVQNNPGMVAMRIQGRQSDIQRTTARLEAKQLEREVRDWQEHHIFRTTGTGDASSSDASSSNARVALEHIATATTGQEHASLAAQPEAEQLDLELSEWREHHIFRTTGDAYSNDAREALEHIATAATGQQQIAGHASNTNAREALEHIATATTRQQHTAGHACSSNARETLNISQPWRTAPNTRK